MLRKEYFLKHRDVEVIKFNIETKRMQILNSDFLPLSIRNMEESYDMVTSFCADRMLMANREYCKEILTACGIDDQSAVSICIISRALSFRDNYWICAADSNETWSGVNLYQNDFSFDISKVALTGDIHNITIDKSIGDHIYTGELTNKGTRAKCYLRDKSGLHLLKNETMAEITSEVVSHYIANGFGLECTFYEYRKVFGKDCSYCKIYTSEQNEMIPFRDIMSYYGEHRTAPDNKSYLALLRLDPYRFIKMQLFDYITLNIDRNRDNYGVLCQNQKLLSLYPIFDHDSCFKGKSVNAVYFPSGLTFRRTLEMLKEKHHSLYQALYPQLQELNQYLATEGFQSIFFQYKSAIEYDGMMERANDLL